MSLSYFLLLFVHFPYSPYLIGNTTVIRDFFLRLKNIYILAASNFLKGNFFVGVKYTIRYTYNYLKGESEPQKKI